MWHRRVGSILEKMYGTQVHFIAPQLALHFELGGEPERATAYYLRASDRTQPHHTNEQMVTLPLDHLSVKGHSLNVGSHLADKVG
jgi:hypothetical protein